MDQPENTTYTILGPADGDAATALELPFRLQKSLSIRREPKINGDNLRALYRNSASPTFPHQRSSQSASEQATLSPTTPNLPPTPPFAEHEGQQDTAEEMSGDAAESVKARSLLVTPINQMSPPTPDDTPPRELPVPQPPFLGARPSISSTKAESFKTAHEEIPSDYESDHYPYTHQNRSGRLRNLSTDLLTPLQMPENIRPRPSPLAHASSPVSPEKSQERHPLDSAVEISPPTAEAIQPPIDPTGRQFERHIIGTGPAEISWLKLGPKVREEEPPDAVLLPLEADEPDAVKENESPQEAPVTAISPVIAPSGPTKGGRSLRDRLRDSNRATRRLSTEKFADIIGWTEDVVEDRPNRRDQSRRWSGVSTASTVEAYVVDAPTIPKKRGKLRHVSKTDSLRSVSSPLPRPPRHSPQSAADSPHRLLHKRAKLTEHDRSSFGSSDLSKVVSSGSAPVVVVKPEIIRVAVIPERGSSLPRSQYGSRRHSFSASTHSGGAAWHSRQLSGQSRNSSQTRPALDRTTRGRDRYYPPQAPPHIPARSSSLSAPTSRSTSRANSLTTQSVNSENLRTERKKAEKDLRKTLDRIESEILASKLNTPDRPSSPGSDVYELEAAPSLDVRAHDFATGTHISASHANPPLSSAVPGTHEWAELRRRSMIATPFSQPSFASASPEINDAKAVNLFPHTNRSIQLIDPVPVLESQAVQAVGRRRLLPIGDSRQVFPESPLHNAQSSPPMPTALPQMAHETAPGHRQFKTFPAGDVAASRHHRPTLGAVSRDNSFARTLLRHVSLKHAKNRKADEYLEPDKNPFWRPRAFWDDVDPEARLREDTPVRDDGIVQNSLGVPMQRSVMSGPVSLMHRLSKRRRTKKVLAKQGSYSSLQRFRAGRRLYRIPGLGIHFQLMSLRDIQNRVLKLRQRRENAKMEYGEDPPFRRIIGDVDNRKHPYYNR